MLTIYIPENELYNDDTGEFITIHPKTLQMEHSLISISKWESKWKKPFMDGKQKTNAETLDYYRCMTITQNVDPVVYLGITPDINEKILAYINDPMTATTINRKGRKGGREIITSELVYYWMTSLNIPFECERWHLNRLLTLIEIASIKNQPSKKMSQKEIMNQNRSLNAARKARLGSTG